MSRINFGKEKKQKTKYLSDQLRKCYNFETKIQKLFKKCKN